MRGSTPPALADDCFNISYLSHKGSFYGMIETFYILNS